VSLDPFSAERPAASLTLPLLALVIALLILGVVVGGMAARLRQAQWRRTARRLEREAGDLRSQVDSLKRAGAPTTVPGPVEPPPRLQLRPPTR
jgi:hypothetical protein